MLSDLLIAVCQIESCLTNCVLSFRREAASWACEDSGIKEGLWLNLSDGYIGSGRRQVGANGEMSGGTGAALKHYQEQKAYPSK